MAFPTLGAQQETNRKILEDLQLKKQLLQKGVSPVVGNITGLGTSPVIVTASINQMPGTQFLGQQSEFAQNTLATAQRSVFNPSSNTTLGSFITQDSYYGNTFIPVLPRLDPIPPNHPAK